MKVSAVLTRAAGRWIAHCEEVDRAGEGDTPEQAVSNLRQALEEYFGYTEAVAPPPEPALEAIEVEVIGAP
ncbi:MAG: type II toxin-antitoxin system HicB family antitoxin [Polyangiaceae bacterium]